MRQFSKMTPLYVTIMVDMVSVFLVLLPKLGLCPPAECTCVCCLSVSFLVSFRNDKPLSISCAQATNEFLDELAAKNSDERTAFFGGLLEVLPRLPRSCCIHKVLPALETAVEQAAADKVSAHVVLAPALQIGAKLDEEEFKDKILPKLVNWFSSQDQALVAALIENMGTFVGFCDQRTVSEKIWPKLVPAFTNSVPLIREVAVKSIPGLVRGDKLTDRLINHDLIKAFTALLNDRCASLQLPTVTKTLHVEK
eukprot:SAG31_NODE_992_length_10517_cov_6.577942_4_plen_253_part_00